MAEHLTSGQYGEQLALGFVQKLGYNLLDTNWRYRYWEVDIVAMDGDVLVFIEVKSRTSLDFGDPIDFVDWKKRRNLIKIAEAYLQKMDIRNTQYLIVRHHDRSHPHIHLCINRIDNEGKLISDKNEKYRSTKVCRELTEKHGLYIAPGKENVNRERLIGYDKTKYEIYDVLKQAIPKSKTWNDLEKQLKKSGIIFQFKTAGKTANIQGIIFEKDGIKINGSKVDRECSYSKIDSEIKSNAFQALQEVKRQSQQTGLAEGAIETLTSLIAQLSIFTTPNSSHYDATLAEYIQALKARKWAAKNKIRIHRVR